MKTLQIKAEKRTAFGGKTSRSLRREGLIPCVVYGKKEEPMHCIIDMMAIKPLNYAPAFVHLKIGKKTLICILQAKQVDPIKGTPIHADFLLIDEKTPIMMHIPLVLENKSAGEKQGGVLLQKARRIKVRALPGKMPEKIAVDISDLQLGKTMKVKTIATGDYMIEENPDAPIAFIEIPRALRSRTNAEAAAEGVETPGEKAEA